MHRAHRSFYLFVLLPGLSIPLVAILLPFWGAVSLGEWTYRLPLLHAMVNGATALLLLMALWAIKRKNVRLHARLMSSCVALGFLFLCSYVLYHLSVPSTIYGDLNKDGILSEVEAIAVGASRTLYLSVLASHIILSVPVVFCVLMVLHYARERSFKQHSKWAKYVFPIWWYVSASGVVVYLMIRPFYAF